MKSTSRKITSVTLVAGMLFGLCACQPAPKKETVVSKNDGAFDSKVIQSVTPVAAGEETQEINYQESFSSTDGSVAYTMDIAETQHLHNNPVVKVVPHYLTGEDAKRVASVLLEGTPFYEEEPILMPNYSKAQIQERLSRWTEYSNEEAIRTLYGDQVDAQYVLDIVKGFIEEYTGLLATAEDKELTPCRWIPQKASYFYAADPEEFEECKEKNFPDDNDEIHATAKKDGVEYNFYLSTRNQEDYRISSISLNLGSGTSPVEMDSRIYRAMLCRTSAPTDEQIAKAEEQAQDMLNRMELGEWHVDASKVEKRFVGDTVEYTIYVTAVPVIDGVAAIRRPQLSNLRSDASFASNYYLTDAEFWFSANGDLVEFNLDSPVDIEEKVNENVAVMPMDELIERAKTHLSLFDQYQYGISKESLDIDQREAGEKFICNVNISKLETGMLRVKVPNTDESYYYVPGIVLSGTVDHVGVDTGTVYASSGEEIYLDRVISLVALNAVDGSIIPLYNE